MNARTQQLCAWCAPVMVVVWGVGFWYLANFMPPPGPNTTGEQWAAIIQQHTTAIRFGLILCVFGSVLLVPFFAVISVHMKRIEGQDSPLAYTQMLLGLCAVLEFLLPPMIFQAAAFRPDRNPEIILSLVDLTWVWFWGITQTFIIELIIIGIVVLQDRRPDPWLPRWFGYFNIWASLGFVPGTFLVFFKSGPLAWNGFFTAWLPVLTFALVWMPVVIWNIVRAARKTELSHTPTAVSGPDRSAGNGAASDDVRAELERLTDELGEMRGRLAELSRVGG